MPRQSLSRIAAPVALAVLLVLGIAAPAFACSERLPVQAADDIDAAATGTAVSAITPGSVNRTSLNLSATYSVGLTLNYASRSFMVNSVATITNTSGGPIDRIELNTIAARLGGMSLRVVQVDGRNVPRRVSDQTIVVPLGGILAAGDTVKVRTHYLARLRSSLSGSNWLFTKVNGIVDAYRWIPWVSRATPFTRPNHGDPFVTPVSPDVAVTLRADRRLVVASTADRVSVSSDGRTQRFVARNVRDVTITAAPDFRTATVLGRVDQGALLLPLVGQPRVGRGCRGGRLPGDAVAPGPVSLPHLQGRPIGGRVRHGIAGDDLDPVRRGQREPALSRRS